MDTLIDKVLILIMCMAIMLGKHDGETLIGCMLVAIVIASLFIIVDKAIYRKVMCIVIMILMIAVPELVYFIPIFAYDVIGTKDKLMTTLFLICAFLEISRNDISTGAIIVLVVIVSLWMTRQTEKKNSVEKKIIQNRDNSFELTEALKNKNRALVEKQEYEIYAATLSERNRIAREIHDNVGHMLSRSILQVGALLAIHKEENINRDLVMVKETLDSAMNSIRESVHDLHDASIDLEMGVREAVDGMKGYDVELIYDIDGDVADNVKHCFLTTVKEALANVHKHSDGNKVWISINEHPAFYQCIVKDNGTKNNVSKGISQVPGIGLENIRGRVENLGGTLLITNEDGYRLFVMIPKK